MRSIAPIFIGLTMMTAAQAQTGAPGAEFQPMPDVMPDLLIAPAPLSGILLRPLGPPLTDSTPEAGAAIEATPAIAEASAEPVAEAVAQTAAVAGPAAALAETAAAAMPVTVEAGPEPADLPEEEPLQAAQTAVPALQPAAAPAAPDDGSITVIIEGVETNQGLVNVAVCDKGLSEEGCPHTQEVRAAQGFVEARFEGIPPGVYAVVGYHDVNGNNEFDKFLGVPREPYALSNRAGQKMVPTFGDAALRINEGENTVIIKLQRLLGG